MATSSLSPVGPCGGGVVVVLALLAVAVVGLPCTSDQLATFKETTIAAPVNKCMSASEVRFTMPPTRDFIETQRDQICDERICKDMIAAIDDMEVPRCDVLYNGKNVTLQTSLDFFTAVCDAPRSKSPEAKKRLAKKGASSAAPSTRVDLSTAVIALVATAVVGLGASLVPR